MAIKSEAATLALTAFIAAGASLGWKWEQDRTLEARLTRIETSLEFITDYVKERREQNE